MVALTGEAASDAHTRGQELVGAVSAAATLHGDDLAAATRDLNDKLDRAEISAALKVKLRAQVGELERKLFQERKAANEARKANFSSEIAKTAAQAVERGQDVLVTEADVDGDIGIIKTGLEALRAVAPDLPVFFFSVDEAKGQLTGVADTPQSVIDRGLNAKEWVSAALAACGGKGGGRPTQAQGKSKKPELKGEGIAAAEKFAREKLAQ